VLRSGVPIWMVGYNVTDRCRFSLRELRELTSPNTQLASTLRALTDVYFGVVAPLRKPNWHRRPFLTLHDPLAVAVAATGAGLVEFQRTSVFVGATGKCPIIDDPKRRRSEIVLDVGGRALREDQGEVEATAAHVHMAHSVSVRAVKRFVKPYLLEALRRSESAVQERGFNSR